MIFCIIIRVIIDEKSEIYINKSNINVSNVQKLYEANNIKEKIIDKYNGYDVAAKLIIPKIDLETYVIGEFSKEILNISVSKFWGPEPNEIGNCCIAGHNFKNKNMFHNLKKLNSDDEIFLIDNKIGKIKYKVYEIYTVSPQNVDCLSQNVQVRELTLITCTNDSKNRIIVKAREEL